RAFHVTGVQTCALPILARKAGELAAGRKVDRIRNIVWVQPLVVQADHAVDVMIELKPSGDSALFEVSGTTNDGGRTLFAQGRLRSEERRVGKAWEAQDT